MAGLPVNTTNNSRIFYKEKYGHDMNVYTQGVCRSDIYHRLFGEYIILGKIINIIIIINIILSRDLPNLYHLIEFLLNRISQDREIYPTSKSAILPNFFVLSYIATKVFLC